jgi:hypothetical protein
VKQRVTDVFSSPVVFYPLLLAAFPILFLYAYNISETSANQIWLPLGVSVAATLVLWAVLSLALRSLAKAGLAVGVLLVFFFSYGRIYDVLDYWGLFVPKHAHLFPVTLFIWGYCVYFISRARRDFRVTTRLLNVVALVLVVINLFNIGSYHIRLARVSDEQLEQRTGQTSADPSELSDLPDIYFIILDEYAHPDTVKEWYDYDNSDFIRGLEERGFFVAYDSKTRTPHSHQAIAQILNMKYLDDEPWSDTVFRRIGYSHVADFLKTQGYHYIAFGDPVSLGAWADHVRNAADLYFNYYETAAVSWASEFQYVLWDTTMLKPFYVLLVGDAYQDGFRRVVLSTFAHLQEIPFIQGPQFVFAHLLTPHEPFVFGPGGELVAPVNWFNYGDKQFYLGQYVYVTREIVKVIDAILERSEAEPIIVIQSDHGLRSFHQNIAIGADEWRKILNAMYLPGVDYDEISHAVSPVNTFRLIFNHYFEADYPLLEDD